MNNKKIDNKTLSTDNKRKKLTTKALIGALTLASIGLAGCSLNYPDTPTAARLTDKKLSKINVSKISEILTKTDEKNTK